jgi:hypothetical protein
MRIPLSQIEKFDEKSPKKIKYGWRERANFRPEYVNTKRYWHEIDFFKEAEFFIFNSIGKNVDTAFHEFCERFPKVVCGVNTRDYFLEFIKDDRWNKLYVDNQKRIQRKQVNHKPKKHIDIPTTTKNVVIEVNKKFIEESIRLQIFLIDRIPYPVYMKMMYNKYITVEQYNSLFRRYHLSEFDLSQFIRKLINDEPHLKQYKWPYDDFRFSEYTYSIFREKDITEYKRYYKGEKEFHKFYAERDDSTRKINRERKREKQIWEENLLHAVEEYRKQKEREQNIVTRDRFGFDDQSFKGEFYHGQKRKKKNKH